MCKKKKLIFEDFLIDYYKNIFRQSDAKKLRKKKININSAEKSSYYTYPKNPSYHPSVA